MKINTTSVPTAESKEGIKAEGKKKELAHVAGRTAGNGNDWESLDGQPECRLCNLFLMCVDLLVYFCKMHVQIHLMCHLRVAAMLMHIGLHL